RGDNRDLHSFPTRRSSDLGGEEKTMSQLQSEANFIFCKIVSGAIPAKKAYEDDEVIAFHDIRPQAPVHLLVVPKAHLATLYDAQDRKSTRLNSSHSQISYA